MRQDPGSACAAHVELALLAGAGGGEHSWTYQVGTALKESTEVAGWLTVGLGCCRASAGDGATQREALAHCPLRRRRQRLDGNPAT
jgi:hypothetical protein